MKIVIIGGVAAGMSAASQAKRRNPSAEVIVLERGEHISYGACGMPYNIEDPQRNIEDLVVFTQERAQQERGLDVRTRHEVRSIDTAKRTLQVQDLAQGASLSLEYDALVIATGASAVRPPLPGFTLPGVHVLRELSDGDALKRALATGAAKRAVILGAGYIGMEMAEALVGRGLEVTVVERAPALLPGFEATITQEVSLELEKRGVTLALGQSAERIEQQGSGLALHTDLGVFHADLILVAVGVRPNVALAKEAGIALGSTGAIQVDDAQRTSAPGVYAAGDCAEARHLVSGEAVYIPLGTTANKQGKVAGANAVGADERFGGVVGSAVFKIFDLEVGRTGLSGSELARLGLEARSSSSRQRSRGHGYPGGTPLHTVLFTEQPSGRLLGAQMVGREGVTGRIDTFATALTARMTVAQIEALDLAYAPPFAPVYDPVLIAANVAVKSLTAKQPR